MPGLPTNLIDMETHYIGGVQRFSTEDGPGIRTTVFLKGCPLSCKWCHNPELLERSFELLYRVSECILCGRCVKSCPVAALAVEENRVRWDREACTACGSCVRECCTEALHTKSATYSLEGLMTLLERDRDYYQSSGGGITLSGGEVLAHGAYALEIAEEARRRGFSVAVETSGYGSWEELRALAACSDWVLFDLKHMDPAAHKFYTGVAPEPIWRNLEKLAGETGMRERIVVRVPCVHGVNDSLENMEALRDYMVGVGLNTVHLLPYHNMGVGKARTAGIVQEEFETPPDEALLQARRILQDAGLLVTIMGHED